MSKPDDIAELLTHYANRTESARIPFSGFLQFCRRVSERKASQEERYVDLGGVQAHSILVAHLRALQQRERLTLSFSSGEPVEIHYIAYYIYRLRNVYSLLEEHPSTPFPNEDNIDFELPTEVIHPVGVTEEFTKWIEPEDEIAEQIVRLQFPAPLTSILVVSDMIPEKLLHVSIQKIRLHLRSEKNAGYMHHKLLSHFPNREVAVRDSLNQLLTTPRDAVTTVVRPTDFTYNFWTQVTNSYIKDLKTDGHSSSDIELGVGQSAYLIAYYNTHFRGADQKRREKEAAEKLLESAIASRDEPFTFADIAATPDEHGNPVSKRISNEVIASHIERKLEPVGDTQLPEVLLIRAADGHEYYVTRAHALSYMLAMRQELADALREHYLKLWSAALREDRPRASMKSDEAFDRHIGKEVAKRRPVFHGMLNYELISLLENQAPPEPSLRGDLRLLTDSSQKSLRRLSEMFELDRKKLYKDAELRLPFYLATPVFRAIFRFFRRLAGGQKGGKVLDDVSEHPGQSATRKFLRKPGASDASLPAEEEEHEGPEILPSESAGGAGSAAKGAASKDRKGPSRTEYRKKVEEVSKEFIPPGTNLEEAMSDLVEKWNPLLDPEAKRNLVEDVNSLVRDFLRRMRAGFRIAPPGPERIRKMADELSQKDSFSDIRRKDALKRYIELYMLKLLGKR